MKTTRNLQIISLAVLAAAILIAACLLPSFFAAAEQPTTFSVESKSVHRGQRFTLSVYVSNNGGMTGARLAISYNKDVFKLVDVTRGSALSDMHFSRSGNFGVYPFIVMWDSITADSSDGEIVHFTFDSDISAPQGDYQFTLTDLESHKEGEAPVVTSGVVTLNKGKYTAIYQNWDGDKLWDGEFNDGDALEYGGKDKPSRPADEMYSYEWEGEWTAAISEQENVLLFVPRFKLTPMQYQISYYLAENVNAEPKLLEEFSEICDYGSEIEFPAPAKENRTFMGWYTDSSYTQKFDQSSMPARDVELYGYFKLNVRAQAPAITLSDGGIDGEDVLVNVTVTDNVGLCDLVLTLDYDRSAFKFVGFTRGEAFSSASFEHTNTQTPAGYDVDPFKFHWSSGHKNITDNGALLTLRFRQQSGAKTGGYPVTFTYDPTSDALYADNFGNSWLSALDVTPCTLSVGTLNSWKSVTDQNKVPIELVSSVDLSAATELVVEHITSQIDFDEQDKLSDSGKGKLLAAYSIDLQIDGKSVSVPQGAVLTVRIKLSSEQLKAANLRLYYVDDDGKMTLFDSKVDGEYLVFQTSHLSKWVILGDNVAEQGSSNLAVALIAVFAALCLAFVIVVIVRLKKGKEIFRYDDKGGDR